MKLKPRGQALHDAKKWYFSGKPCGKRGHTTKRSSKDGSCAECRLIDAREKRDKIRVIFSEVD